MADSVQTQEEVGREAREYPGIAENGERSQAGNELPQAGEERRVAAHAEGLQADDAEEEAADDTEETAVEQAEEEDPLPIDKAQPLTGELVEMREPLFPRDGDIVEKVRLEHPVRFVTAYKVTYLSQGLRVKGYLVLPRKPERCPGLVYCRGGIGRVGMVRLPRLAALAKLGYAVFAPFYRGNDGGEGRDQFGGDDTQDVCAAIALLRSQPEVLPRPVALVGFSRGAVNALQAARDCPDAGPVVVWSGVSDLLETYEERVDMRRMLKRVVGHPKKDPDAYLDRSPVAWAGRIQPPVLILHGTADANVSPRQAGLLADALAAEGRDCTALLFGGEAHAFSREAEREAMRFLARWLENKWTSSTFCHV
ncbi:hypothetical protein J31TS4_45420 [Paenibacillus sp. J31TS4]|uniref:alpha/beta hydrolase family protein n=1 Tax=Paenibacillus sp. J31TS4 TaxID=2807195 RepID=UPI001B052A9F|nr:prolyl oligopeptidase family serine peptidase [Paenibacillus sp. J31TS4]GIP41262.1 hypothetical protein J31TS4_45420 [Paenibacillus sp. J31TS4]